jgi:hypothetical protein
VSELNTINEHRVGDILPASVSHHDSVEDSNDASHILHVIFLSLPSTSSQDQPHVTIFCISDIGFSQSANCVEKIAVAVSHAFHRRFNFLLL